MECWRQPLDCLSIITTVMTPEAMRLKRDRTAIPATYHKLASSPVTLRQSQQLHASASFPLSTSAAVHSQMCAPASVCVRVPRERVMRTAGARLNNQGSLAEKWARAPTLPEAGGRQSSSASQFHNLQPTLHQDSATCLGKNVHLDPSPPQAHQCQQPKEWCCVWEAEKSFSSVLLWHPGPNFL